MQGEALLGTQAAQQPERTGMTSRAPNLARFPKQGWLTVGQAPAGRDGSRYVRVFGNVQLLKPAGKHPAARLRRGAHQAEAHQLPARCPCRRVDGLFTVVGWLMRVGDDEGGGGGEL